LNADIEKETSIGEIFGKIRSERSNKQDYFVKKRISRKTLWNFENNLSNISYDNYLFLLDKINFSQKDIDFTYSKYNKQEVASNPKFIKDKYTAMRTLKWRNATEDEIKSWIIDASNLLKKTNDFFYLHFCFVMRKLLKDKFISKLDLTSEIAYVVDHLMKIEHYSYIDLALFIDYLEYLSEPLILILEKELQRRVFSKPISHSQFSYYFVLRIKYFFRLNNFEKYKKDIAYYLNCLKQCVENLGDPYNIHVLYIFFSELYKIKNNEIENVMVNRHIEMLHYFNNFDEYEDCYGLLNQILYDVQASDDQYKKFPFIV
jgi:hypothetical protein